MNTDIKHKRIAVVMGGPSSEAEVSRRTGKAVLDALKATGYDAIGLELEPPTFCAQIAASGCGLVFNAVHGAFGEDGRLQAALEMLGIPYTGSGVLAAAITMNKTATKRVLLAEGIPTPRSVVCTGRDKVERDLPAEIARAFAFPLLVKAAEQGSSIGVVIVESAARLAAALDEAFSYGEYVLVEEFVRGTELTVAVLGDHLCAEALPTIEITTTSGRYDYDSKYTAGASRHIIPARISAEAERRARETALRVFRVCGCRGVARVDMMLAANDVPQVIDVNTIPGMTATSLVPDAARAVGISFAELCERVLLTASLG